MRVTEFIRGQISITWDTKPDAVIIIRDRTTGDELNLMFVDKPAANAATLDRLVEVAQILLREQLARAVSEGRTELDEDGAGLVLQPPVFDIRKEVTPR